MNPSPSVTRLQLEYEQIFIVSIKSIGLLLNVEYAEHLELMRRSILAIKDSLYSPAEKAAWIKALESGNLDERLNQQFVMEVTDDDESLIGFASFTEEEIDMLYVDPEHQGQGIAHDLLEDIEDYARQEEWPHLNIFASKALFSLAIRHGYEVKQKQEIAQGDQTLTRFYMQKPLSNKHHYARYLIESDRLYMREMLSIDAENFYNLNLDLEVRRYTGDGPYESIEESREFLENYDPYTEEGMGRFTMIRKEDGQTLGWCGLRELPDGDVDLGFRLHQKYWRQGYASEASIACLEWGKAVLELTSVIGRCHPDNTASQMTLKKVGMHFEKESIDEFGEPMLVFRLTL